jgi:hypothetical protein
MNNARIHTTIGLKKTTKVRLEKKKPPASVMTALSANW